MEKGRFDNILSVPFFFHQALTCSLFIPQSVGRATHTGIEEVMGSNLMSVAFNFFQGKKMFLKFNTLPGSLNIIDTTSKLFWETETLLSLMGIVNP